METRIKKGIIYLVAQTALDQADLDMVASKPKRLGDLPPLGLRPWFAPPQSSFFAKALCGFQTVSAAADRGGNP